MNKNEKVSLNKNCLSRNENKKARKKVIMRKKNVCNAKYYGCHNENRYIKATAKIRNAYFLYEIQ